MYISQHAHILPFSMFTGSPNLVGKLDFYSTVFVVMMDILAANWNLRRILKLKRAVIRCN